MFLLRNLGRLLSRGHILETVWGLAGEISTRTVDTHVSRLRGKLGLTPEYGWRLTSIYQHGYRLERLVDPSGSVSPKTISPARS
ncbi:MAG: helix-turn-helix domain-containing protein [Comamonadaceae bacterium]|nr:helix-turn-helix domain-containing protein [Comamonadaceae bacterium]